MAAPTLQEVLASEPQLAGAIDSMNELVPEVSANKGKSGQNGQGVRLRAFSVWRLFGYARFRSGGFSVTLVFGLAFVSVTRVFGLAAFRPAGNAGRAGGTGTG